MTNVALVAVACGLIIGLGAMGACIVDYMRSPTPSCDRFGKQSEGFD